MLLLYFLFVHVSLLIPGYVIVSNTRLFKKQSGLGLCFSYLVSLFLLALLATASYVLKLNPLISQLAFWVTIFGSLAVFMYQKLYYHLLKELFPLACLLAMTVFSLAFISLSFNAPHTIIPDPEPRADRNYNAFNVKVLNVTQTNANDNYIPYRQAQFFVNRSDPSKDSFIDEWGVHFFQRTPLMGAVTAEYLNALNDPVPVDYLWSGTSLDPAHTYQKFQIIAHVLNAILILPGFYLIWYFFDRKSAKLALLFIVPSHFFVYNAVFSWPKSLVAFFILLSWLLIIQKRFRYLVLAGMASGMAYLTHDLAVLYIAASVLLLLYQKRFRDTLAFTVISAAFAIPWLLTSILYYKKPSSFILYPLSIHNIPQPDHKQEIIREFFHTSPLRLIAIRLDSLFYLLSPYQLIYREGAQTLAQRFWAFSIHSLPGSLGLGLLIPAIFGALKKLRDVPFWILTLVPLIMSVVVIGWPKGLGSLHFAEAIIVLLTGLGCWILSKLNPLWAVIAFMLSVLQLTLFTLHSYPSGAAGIWLHQPADLAMLGSMAAIVLLCAVGTYKTAGQPLLVARRQRK